MMYQIYYKNQCRCEGCEAHVKGFFSTLHTKLNIKFNSLHTSCDDVKGLALTRARVRIFSLSIYLFNIKLNHYKKTLSRVEKTIHTLHIVPKPYTPMLVDVKGLGLTLHIPFTSVHFSFANQINL